MIEGRSERVTVAGASAGTNGFLFCDLRGYTAFVEHHGDQAAADLLATYRSLVRTVIAEHAGAEIKTEGDSVYVVFPAASAAVEAGLGIVAAAAEASSKTSPIRVGVGIHAGETVATTEGLVGGAVNIAARVCAKAQAGEVLVTDTVRALTRTYLPYRYTGLGTQQLKGIAGGIPLYRVEAVPSSARARLSRQLGARRGRVLVVVGLIAVLLAGATGVYALNRPTDCLVLPATTKDVVVKIDPKRNCVVAAYPVGQRPNSVIAADGLIWVGAFDDRTITLVDPVTNTVHATGAGGRPIALVVGPASAFVLTIDGDLAIIPYRTRWIATSVRLPIPVNTYTNAGYVAMAFVSNHLWISSPATGDILRRDAFGGGGGAAIHLADVRSAPNGTGLGEIATALGIVWIANTDTPLLYRLDLTSTVPISISLDAEHGGTTAIATSPTALWLLRSDGYVTRLDLASGGTLSGPAMGAKTGIAASAEGVWVVDLLARHAIRVDPSTGAVVVVVPVGGQPSAVAIAPDGSVWVTLQAP
jgi:class 3 adenylate cyclase/streptogramin lyase